MPNLSDLPKLPPAKFIRIGAFTSAYFVLGPQDGRPLLLCHGLAASSLQFVQDAHFYAEQGYRVIVPDLRGHGRSTCPDQRQDDDFSIKNLATDLIAILNREGVEAIDWVGNSLGGIVALYLMGSDRARLKKFVSFGTSYAISVPPFGVNAFRMMYKILGAKNLASMAAPLTCKRADAKAIIYAMAYHMDVDAVSRIAKHLGSYDLAHEALGFDGPMLMIQGQRDRAVNSALKPHLPAMDKLPNFTRLSLSEAGHCANLDQPEKMRELILGFLGD